MLVVLGHQKYLLLVDCVVNCVAFPLLAGGALWPVTILGQNYFLWQILRRKNNLTLYVTFITITIMLNLYVTLYLCIMLTLYLCITINNYLYVTVHLRS